MPLWHNSLLNIEFRTKWGKKGITVLSDILDDKGNLIKMDVMHQRGLKIHFLDYLKISRSVEKLHFNRNAYCKQIGPNLPRLLVEIDWKKQGCNKTYNKLMKYNGNVIKEIKENWEKILNEDIMYITVEKAFKELATRKENAYKKYLQFKLLHSRTAVNEKLFKMGITNTKLCPLCKTEDETIKHAFLECTHVITLWKHIESWIKNKTKKSIKLSHSDKIFGRCTTNKLIEKIILNAKVLIFKNRKTGKQHHINDAKRAVFKQLQIEEYQANNDLKVEKFNLIWEPVYEELCNRFS